MKCKYCNNTATRYPYSYKEGKCIDVCEWHYHEIKPDAMILSRHNLSKYKKCVLCDTMAPRVIRHHVCYFPELVMQVCVSCHNKIGKGELSYLHPPEYDKHLFYCGNKGYSWYHRVELEKLGLRR